MNITELNEVQKEALESTGLKLDESVVVEYINNTGDEDLSDIEEAYSGEFNSDEDFARDMADNIGAMPRESKWPVYCIDWDMAARDLMMDYFEIQGHYFRSM